MLKSDILFNYYNSNSKIHMLDPRTKIIGIFIYLSSLFMLNNVVEHIFVIIFLVYIIIVSQIPFYMFIYKIKAMKLLLIFTCVINLFTMVGRPVFSICNFNITDEGCKFAVFMTLRIVYIIIGSSIVTLTTTPHDLIGGLEKIMMPLVHIKIPVHNIVFMICITLKFIPIFFDEINKIINAQISRGADFDGSGIIKKVKLISSIMIPLFILTVNRAIDLSMAMDARCYNCSVVRTKYKFIKYDKKDYYAYLILIVYLIMIFILRRLK